MVPAVDAAVRLLARLKQMGPNGARLSTLAQDLELNKSTCYNILQTLRAHGLLAYDEVSKRYTLGPTLVDLGLHALGQTNIITVAHTQMLELVHELGLTTLFLTPTADARVMVVDCIAGQGPAQITFAIGERLSMTRSAAGRHFLAWADKATRERWLEQIARNYPEDGSVDPEMLVAVRHQGYAVALGEYYPSYHAVAAPIFDFRGQNRYSMAVVGLREQIPQDRLTAVADRVRSAAAAVTAAISGRQPAGDSDHH